MKIGILMLAHGNVEQLKTLVSLLKTDFQVFVHIDAKSDIPSDIFDSYEQVSVIKKFPVYWGHVSMIYAILDLLKIALEQSCTYFMLISGQDLPIKPCRVIKDMIEKTPDINYLDYAPLPKADWLNGGFDRLVLYWEILKNREKLSLYNKVCFFLRKIQRVTGLKRKLFPVNYYGGSSWFNISKELAEYILDFTERNPAYLNQFKYTVNTDEIYFHTLIMNSPFVSKVVNDDKRYTDWNSGPEYPRTLRIEDYEKITASDGFFARKFDEKVDKEIYSLFT